MTVTERVPEVYKALVAAGTSLVGTLGAIQAVVESTGVAPDSWVYGLGFAVSAVTGGLTWLKRNRTTVEQVTQYVQENQVAVEAIIEQYKKDNA